MEYILKKLNSITIIMKFSKSLLVAIIAAMTMIGCNQEEAQVEVSSVSLNTATIQMVEGETFNLVATVLPKDAEFDGVIWASSNASVASVNNGMVTALKEGTSTITASAGGKSSTCNVMVSARVIPVTSVTIDKTSLSMLVGETETLSATVTPDNASDKSVIWGSSDVSIATVTDGKVTAKKSGTVIITATSGNCKADCVVTVSVSTESVILDKTSLSLIKGETAIIIATVKPDDATDKTVTWSSSDESVAKVDGGKVTALKAGRATITAKCGEKKAECSVTVSVPVASITLDKTSLSLIKGETVTITATVKPDDATDKTVTWSSSDESVAKVDGGKVTAVKAGKVTITAKCGEKKAECSVMVSVLVSSVTLDKTNLSLIKGETAIITATVKPDDATDKTVTWSSSDESVAKVDGGKVTAVNAGRATITAKCGDKKAECSVTVSVPVATITLDKTTLSLTPGETSVITATVKPDDATDKTVTWSSSDESVAKVDGGKVTAVKAGTAVISAMSGGKIAKCDIVVIAKVKGVNLDRTSLRLMTDETFTLTATVYPDNAENKNVFWSSDNESVVTVDNGLVIAKAEGSAAIKVVTEDGQFTATCTIAVTNDITKYVSAQYYGGSMSIINDLIQYGSKLNFGVDNNSKKTIYVKTIQLIDGVTGVKGNVMSVNYKIAGGSSGAWTITIGIGGIHKPIAKFVYEYEGKEYSTQAQYRDYGW